MVFLLALPLSLGIAKASGYPAAMGGKQPGLELAAAPTRRAGPALVEEAAPAARTPRPLMPTEAELAAHAAFVAKKLKEPLWLQPPFTAPTDQQS